MSDESTPRDYRRIEGSVHAWWARKTEAIAAAGFIGWRARDVGKVHTRFGSGWGIRDNDGSWMTQAKYAELARGIAK